MRLLDVIAWFRVQDRIVTFAIENVKPLLSWDVLRSQQRSVRIFKSRRQYAVHSKVTFRAGVNCDLRERCGVTRIRRNN